MRTIWIVIVLFIACLVACSSPSSNTSTAPFTAPKKQARVTLSANKVALGEDLTLAIQAPTSPAAWRLLVQDSLWHQQTGDTATFSTADMLMGQQVLRIEVQLADSSWEKHRRKIVVLSPTPPQRYAYLLQARHPHDTEAYTQGLLLHADTLYEGTGQKGKSFLQSRRWPTGTVLQTTYLPDRLFGEGIALHNDKLYQLTWKAHQGFIYAKKTLAKVGTFNYPTEGWGLTSWQDYLVMSDGSERLYFYHPNPWRHSHNVQVYDQTGPVSSINELEAVGNYIYANQYEQERLLVIDPYNGMLVGTVDVSTLFDAEAYAQRTGKKAEVMNGIAYNDKNNHLLLTGKQWPYIYEVLLRPISAQ